MSNYYCQISGLPDLALNSENSGIILPEFVKEIKPYLEPLHQEWFDLILYSLTHKTILDFYLTGNFSDTLAAFFKPEWFDPETKQLHLLPNYLQQCNTLFYGKKDELKLPEMELIVYEEYYKSLCQSGNNFIKNWAIFEMDFRNYLVVKVCEENQISKYKQIVKGNVFADKLLGFTLLNKEVQVEWPYSEKVNAILETTNLFQKELAIGQLKWDVIDELNLFNYFSIEVLLGYLLKLMILERWKNLRGTVENNLVESYSESVIKDYKTLLNIEG